MGGGVVGGFCVERSHAARRHAQRCGAPKAPLKGELAARNALSEGFCGRASGAWSNNALPTSLLLRKTSQSASLTAPLSGEPSVPHTAARAYEQRDSVQRRSHRPRHPPSHNRTLVSASEAASGPLTSLQGTDALANLPGSWYYSTHATDTHPRGWVRRAGSPPPCAASFFLYSFFAGEERMEPPEGDSKFVWKKLG